MLKPSDTKKRPACVLVNTTPTLPRRQPAGHGGGYEAAESSHCRGIPHRNPHDHHGTLSWNRHAQIAAVQA